ncbi:carbohydrate sulfotransferase 6-like [Protopterus annectens]|uniref:carbohydrate sulfotransferase 6-like n=1 Tax=Protopterus annectens TaxID=7888 RepID=UPI001CFBF8DD|nr:carbohydrate sulfotransferase 6-like [Protopterus annectens]
MARLIKLQLFIALQASVMVVFIFLVHNRDLQLYQKSQERNKTELNLNQSSILIISSWRSGSSFLGQLFNINPNVFYLMEPAWHVWKNFRHSSANSLHVEVSKLLRSLFLCNTSAFDPYIQPHSRLNRNLFAWALSRALCSPPACDAYDYSETATEEACSEACGSYSLRNVEEVCQAHTHIVLKEVRILSLEPLYSLLKDPALNLKIIHLVRDPRGVFKSRSKERSALNFDSNILYNNFKEKRNFFRYFSVKRDYELLEEICKSQVNMYKQATQQNHSFIKGRYKMVRFEDLTKDPLKVASDLYEFTNLTLTPKLQTWIYNLTHGTGDGGKYGSFQVSPRDAVHVSEAWKTELSIFTIQQIEQQCAEAIQVFGYDFFMSKDKQRS